MGKNLYLTNPDENGIRQVDFQVRIIGERYIFLQYYVQEERRWALIDFYLQNSRLAGGYLVDFVDGYTINDGAWDRMLLHEQNLSINLSNGILVPNPVFYFY